MHFSVCVMLHQLDTNLFAAGGQNLPSDWLQIWYARYTELIVAAYEMGGKINMLTMCAEMHLD